MATALTVVMKDIEERKDRISVALESGSARDYADYKHMCGEIRGLSFAHALITDLVRKVEQDDE